jgi:hypothetical protein
MMRDIDYLWLFFVIAAAVTAGNLVSTWITSRLEADEVRRVTAAMQQSLTEQTEALEAQDTQQREQSMEERASSATGKALERTCREWQQAQSQTPTYTTRTEAKKHCARYERYLATGVP